MVILKRPPGTTYNSSPSRPSPREVVQILDAVRARCGYSPYVTPAVSGSNEMAMLRLLCTTYAVSDWGKVKWLFHNCHFWGGNEVAAQHHLFGGKLKWQRNPDRNPDSLGEIEMVVPHQVHLPW